jgi:hypothetical protein
MGHDHSHLPFYTVADVAERERMHEGLTGAHDDTDARYR